MANLKEIFERAQQTGQVEITYATVFGGGTSITPFRQTKFSYNQNANDYSNNNVLSTKAPYIRLGYEGGFPGDAQFRTDDPTNTYNTLLATTRDTARIGAFFADIPRGPLWLVKQTTLQLTNPDVSYKSVGDRVTLADKISQLEGPRFYNPAGINTLASVAGNALGLHFTRHGLSPTNETGYLSLNTTLPGGNDFVSRLTLYKEKLSNFSGDGTLTLNKYTAGPNSFYGLGSTTTKAYTDSFLLNTGETDKGVFYGYDDQKQYNSFVPFNYDTINVYSDRVSQGLDLRVVEKVISENPDIENPNDIVTLDVESFVVGKIQDFRKIKNSPNAQNYPKYNIHSRIGVTTPSDPNSVIGPMASVDSINVLTITPRSVYYGNAQPATNKMSSVGSNLIYSGLYKDKEVLAKTNGNYARDIIKFHIELLNNDRPTFENVINTDVLAFRAYLGDLSDDITPTWKSFNYMGRGEDFYVYEKFTRTINFSFYLFAHSKYEMPAIYTKLNYLMSSMAPDYNAYNQMRGTYAYLTIGSYIYQQPGVFTKMSISDLLTAPWEITLEEPEDRKSQTGPDVKQHDVPKYMKVSMTFNPIHNFLPRKNKRETAHTATFITPNFRVGHPNYYLPQGGNNKPPLIDVPEKNIPVQ